MSAYTTDTAAFVTPSATQPRTLPGGSSGMFGKLLRWVAEMPRRQAVINELDALTDRELADIGLIRTDVPRVFDPSFRPGGLV